MTTTTPMPGAALTPKDRLVVALDVAAEAEALALVNALRGRVGMFKVGLELFTAAGPALVRQIVDAGDKVFLDLKLHDIPNTVRRAASAARRLGASLLTVHGLGGSGMLAAAAEAVEGSATRILAITILTSHDQASLAAVGVGGELRDSVLSLGRLAQAAGAAGVVASPQEIGALRAACGPVLPHRHSGHPAGRCRRGRPGAGGDSARRDRRRRRLHRGGPSHHQGRRSGGCRRCDRRRNGASTGLVLH